MSAPDFPSLKERQFAAQGGRCQWCQHLIPFDLMTFDHITPRRGLIDRRRGRADCVLACEPCNKARRNKTIGSVKFTRWLRHVMAGNRNWQRSNQRQQFAGVGCA